MNLSVIIKAALCATIATGMVSCGSSNGSDSSTETGNTVVGKIIGFGSIIMNNGVEYETDGLSDCDVDDTNVAGVCEDDLSVGMHVTLRTDDNGVVTALKYDDELEGVASSVSGSNGDFTFEVFGVTVSTVNPDTEWDDFSTNPPSAAELDGANVEISGEWQGNMLVASYVEKQENGDSSHEVKGTVGVLTGTNFTLTLRNGIAIDVNASAVDQLPLAGEFVEVKGNYNDASGIFTATEIENEDEDDFDSDSEAEITGTLLADAGSSTGFSIGNTGVDISAAPGCNNLVGLEVEAKGRFDVDTGVLVVEECENEEEDLEAKCQISNVTVAGIDKPKVGSVECAFPGTVGGPIVINFNDSPNLAMFSDDSTASTSDLTNYSAGDCVEIKFSRDSNGGYDAGLIKQEGNGACDSYDIEATVDSFNDGVDITVLDITFTASPTSYDPVGSNLTLSPGDEVKIVDIDGDGNVYSYSSLF